MARKTEVVLSRRGFLIATGTVLATAAVRTPAGAQAPPAPPVPGKARLIVRSPRPLNLETRLGDLADYHTPESLFFVRNNYDAPPVDPAQWSLKLEGELDNPVVLRLDDLRKLPAISQDVTLECAGNGRSFHQPRASGIQWEYGAVGTQRFTGVRLADVLALAKLRRSARYLAFDGADKPPTPQAPDFIRSVPRWKAEEGHTMLAWEMGGRPIPHLHGGPVRVIVPGFVGSASIKWVERLMALTEEFDGFYMKSNYTAPRVDNDKEVYSLQSLEVKSIIVSPGNGAKVAPGRLTAWGWAWSGEGDLTGIDVSTDGGTTWAPGAFTGDWHRYSWRKWEYSWNAATGLTTIMARATDSLGRVQPTSRAFNRLGYRWNVIHAITIDVA